MKKETMKRELENDMVLAESIEELCRLMDTWVAGEQQAGWAQLFRVTLYLRSELNGRKQ